QSKPPAQIDHRDEPPAHAHHPDDLARRPRHLGDGRRLQNLRDERDLHRVGVPREEEREVLDAPPQVRRPARSPRLGPRSAEKPAGPQSLPSSCGCIRKRASPPARTSSMSVGMSSTRPTRWSPSSVAPANPRTIFSDLPSALMTMSCCPTSLSTT